MSAWTVPPVTPLLTTADAFASRCLFVLQTTHKQHQVTANIARPRRWTHWHVYHTADVTDKQHCAIRWNYWIFCTRGVARGAGVMPPVVDWVIFREMALLGRRACFIQQSNTLSQVFCGGWNMPKIWTRSSESRSFEGDDWKMASTFLRKKCTSQLPCVPTPNVKSWLRACIVRFKY